MRTSVYFSILTAAISISEKGLAAPSIGLIGVGAFDPAYSAFQPIAGKWGEIVIGVNLPQDPVKGSSTQIDALTKAANDILRANKHLMVRLNSHPNMGTATNPTGWRTLAGGELVDSWNYPPAGPDQQLWKKIGYWYGQYVQIVKNICEQIDGIPAPNECTGRVTFELSNEVGMCGVSGPYKGGWSSTSAKLKQAYLDYPNVKGTSNYDTWKANWLTFMPEWTLLKDGSPMPCGFVPTRFFQQMIVERKAFHVLDYGFNVAGSTLQLKGAFDGGPAPVGSGAYYELASWAASDQSAQGDLSAYPDAALAGSNGALYKNYFNRVHMNLYSGSALNRSVKVGPGTWIRRTLTPDELIAYWVQDFADRKNAFAINPGLSGKGVGITEANVSTSMVPGSTLAEQEVNVVPYRQAMVNAAKMLPATEVNFFSALLTGSLVPFTFYTWDGSKLTAVGGTDVSPL